MKRLIIGLTGASGVIYGIRALEMLRGTGVDARACHLPGSCAAASETEPSSRARPIIILIKRFRLIATLKIFSASKRQVACRGLIQADAKELRKISPGVYTEPVEVVDWTAWRPSLYEGYGFSRACCSINACRSTMVKAQYLGS